MINRDFLNILFKPGEFICPASTCKEVRTVQLEKYIGDENDCWISANPYRPYTTRAIGNILEFRNFVIEMDNTLLEDQKLYIDRMGVPYSTCVYSGNKSFHFIIALKEDIGYNKYKEASWNLKRILDKNQIDPATLEPSTFTRQAGAINQKTRKEQEVQIRGAGRIDNKVFFEWLESYPLGREKIKVPREKMINNLPTQTAFYLRQGITVDDRKPRHEQLKWFCIDLYNTGLSRGEIHALATRAFLGPNPDKEEAEVVKMLDWIFNKNERVRD